MEDKLEWTIKGKRILKPDPLDYLTQNAIATKYYKKIKHLIPEIGKSKGKVTIDFLDENGSGSILYHNIPTELKEKITLALQ